VCRLSGGNFAAACAAIDGANEADPNHVVVAGRGEPLALAHGRLADAWVVRLDPSAADTTRLAARAHHLRRWEVPRSRYPEGRPGYLRWRRDQKARHAAEVAVILAEVGYGPEAIAEVQRLIRREGLGADPVTQLIEDAACLVFLQTQLGDIAARLERDHLVGVIRKTATKMSPAALALVATIALTDDERSLLTDALG
jgi:hypothetical protein